MMSVSRIFAVVWCLPFAQMALVGPAYAKEKSQTLVTPKNLREFITTHKGTFSGSKPFYKTVISNFITYNQLDNSKPSLFTTGSIHANTRDKTHPVIFAFNGGTGSSSLWLHLGFLGASRVDMSAAFYGIDADAMATCSCYSCMESKG